MFGLGKTKEKEKQKQEEVDIVEIIVAQEELKALKKEYGIEEKKGWISKTVSALFERQANREPMAVSKKKYIWIAVLTGWFGGHRFYVKHYKVGMIYLLLFWMGIGLYHTMLDIFQVIPMQPDENGMIYL